MSRRLVRVFAVDPDQNVLADDSVLFEGDPRITDLTDQELFYEIDIAGILKKHNALRVKMLKRGTKDQYLEPITAGKLSLRVLTLLNF